MLRIPFFCQLVDLLIRAAYGYDVNSAEFKEWQASQQQQYAQYYAAYANGGAGAQQPSEAPPPPPPS
jgi:hypothetical protein